MGLLDFDVSKIANNDAFMLGMGILGNNTGHYGELGPALGGGLQDYQRQKSLIAENQRRNQEMQQRQEYQNQQLMMQQAQAKRQQELHKQQQAQNQAAMGVTGGLPVGLYQHQNPNYKSSDIPSSLREWQIYSKMPKNTQEQFLNMKRASKTWDSGQQQGYYNPVTMQPMPTIQNQLKPSEMPSYKSKVKSMEAQAGIEGKALGEAETELQDRIATLPRLNDVVNELSELGQKATYTHAGQAANTAKRQLGMDVGEGAIARKEYISKVDNEILPLLRQTFGAAFTAQEGESLKATLGDPNVSPPEKDAVLRSFINSKEEQINTLKRRTGKSQSMPQVGEEKGGYRFKGGNPASPNSWEKIR